MSATDKELARHHVIRARWCTWLASFFDLGCFSCCWESSARRLYQEASRRLNDELNVTRLLKRVRNAQVILESTFLSSDNKRRQRLLAHTAPSVIDFEPISRRKLAKASTKHTDVYQEGGDFDLGIEIAISPRDVTSYDAVPSRASVMSNDNKF